MKARKISMKSSPSFSLQTVRDEAMKRFKHQSLRWDYIELQKEIKAKRKKLLRENKRKAELMAEVKFLRRRFKCLSRSPSQKFQCRLRISFTSSVHSEVPHRGTDHKAREDATSIATTALLDLNRTITMNGEDMEEFQVKLEPLNMDFSKECLVS